MLMPEQNLHKSNDESESEDDEEQRTLFCANLDERVTEDLLYEVFLQAGPIDSARIPKDHNGKQRTFGFITFVHKSTIPYAMQLYQGLTLYRKTMTIKHQGSTMPSPMRNYTSSVPANKHSSYDNSSLRGSNYSSIPSQNPFRNSYPPVLSTNSCKKQSNISMHASSQNRPHTTNSPYQRSGGNGDHNQDKERDHYKRRNYNNGSNRHSEQRCSGKNRR